MRLLPFTTQWCKDAEQAERVKKIVTNNYGWINRKLGLFLCHWLLEHGKEKFIDRYKKCREAYLEKCKVKQQAERMSTRIAVILMAAGFANLCFKNLHFDLMGLLDFMVEQEAENNSERTGFGDAYKKIVSFIMGHIPHFNMPIRNKSGCYTGEYESANTSQEEWGQFYVLSEPIEIDGQTAEMEVAIRKHIFKRICERELGYENYKSVLHFLKGGTGNSPCYLNHETGKNTRERKQHGKPVAETVFVLYLVQGDSALEEVREMLIEKEYQNAYINFRGIIHR